MSKGGNNAQKREHVTSSKSDSQSGGKEGGASTEAELGHSGGGGGGGTGAGSLAGAGNEEEIDDLAASASAPGKGEGKGGIDSSKVHPGSVGGGKKEGGGKRDSKL